MQRGFRFLAVLICSLFDGEAGLASSPEAWQAFRAEVASACALAAGDEILNAVVTWIRTAVHPTVWLWYVARWHLMARSSIAFACSTSIRGTSNWAVN